MVGFRPTWVLLLVVGLAACGSGEEEPDFFDYGCGADVPDGAAVYFDRIDGECAVLDPIPYDQIDDEEVNCSILNIDKEGGACDVTLMCMGLVFEGQFFEIEFELDFNEVPVLGSGDLFVYEPETGVECRSTYDVRIE